MASLEILKKELKNLANPRQAKAAQWFFKTGKGEYGEGDIFLGIKVPVVRSVAKKYQGLNLGQIENLLASKIHEHRQAGLFVLVAQYKKADKSQKKKIFYFYLKNKKGINNWDLVDLSAPNIIGAYLLDRPKGALYKLAKSKNLWDKRIAVLATYAFIRNHNFKDILKISKMLLNDKYDLIHKAVGWMLREVGNRDQAIEEKFLKKYYKKMPRTMLRYAIEKFPEKKRKSYLRR